MNEPPSGKRMKLWPFRKSRRRVFALGIDGVPRKVILLSSAMPAAVINFIICERYNLQSDLVASIIATSTLISIITTPIIIIFLL